MDTKIKISNLNTSLEQQALICIVIELWKHKSLELTDYILRNSKSITTFYQIGIKDFASILPDKYPELKLAPFLIKKIYYLIRPIGVEILKWINDQMRVSRNDQFVKLSLENICWTSHGTVDDRRSAELLINSGKLDISIQYRLACNYCLESCAKTLWKNLSEQQKYRFCEMNDLNDMINIMTKKIRIDLREVQSSGHPGSDLQIALYSAILNGNKTQTEFFLGKLTAERKNTTIERLLGRLCFVCDSLEYSEDFWYLTGHMSEVALVLLLNADKQVLQINFPYHIILKLLLDWPVQSFFLDVAQCILPYTRKSDFNCILEYLLHKYQSSLFDYHYMILFKEFLKLKPEFFDLNILQLDLLECFFEARDREGFALIAKGNTSLDINNFVHCYSRIFCELLEFPEEWDFLRFFINEFMKVENLGKFRDLFRKEEFISLKRLGFYNDRKGHYSDLYKFIGDLIQSKGLKRSIYENSPVAKRTRTCNKDFLNKKGKAVKLRYVRWPS